MNIIIKCKKRYLCSISSRNCVWFNSLWNRVTNNSQIIAINSWFGHIKHKNKWGCHWRSAHVILSCQEINRTVLKLFSRIEIVSNSLNTQWWIVIRFYSVLCLTKVAYPAWAPTDESYKRVYIGSALSASNYRVWPKGNRGHWLVILKEINNRLT